MKTFRKWKKHKNKTRKKKQKNKRLKGGVISRRNNGSQNARRNNGSQRARPGSRFARQETALQKHEQKISAGWRHAIRTYADMGCHKETVKLFKTEYDEYKKKDNSQTWEEIIEDFVIHCENLLHLKDLSVEEFEEKLKAQTLLIPDASKSPTTSPRSPLSPLYSDTFRPFTL